jgi:hypothetical protein
MYHAPGTAASSSAIRGCFCARHGHGAAIRSFSLQVTKSIYTDATAVRPPINHADLSIRRVSPRCRTAMVAGDEQQTLSVSGGRPTGTSHPRRFVASHGVLRGRGLWGRAFGT